MKSDVSGSVSNLFADPESRERAFHSGSVDFALSRGLLPDELVMWLLNSGVLAYISELALRLHPLVLSEPRDTLRNAYCRAFKVCQAIC